MAATVTIVSIERSGLLGRMVVDCVGMSAGGSAGQFPATVISGPGKENTGRPAAIKGRLMFMDTNPSMALTANWDVALNNGEGANVLRGAGLNRHTTNSERTPTGGTNVGDAGLASPVFPDESLTLAITGNSVASASTRVVLYWDESGGL